MDTHTKVIVFLLVGVLKTMARESQPVEQNHISFPEETAQSADQEIPAARVLQLPYDTEEGKDSLFRKEEHQPNEGIKGSYGYRDENGDLIVRFYVADGSGYRIVKEERYPSSHRSRDGYDNNKHRNNFYDQDHKPHRTYPRNHHNDFFNRNYRPSPRIYHNYNRQNPNIHKNPHGFGEYYPTHQFRSRDNSQYPNSVYQYNENIRPSKFPEFRRGGDNFNHGHHYSFPTQFFPNNPQRQFFQNQKPISPQTYDGFHGFKNKIRPLDNNYHPFNSIQREPYPVDYGRHYFENFGKGYPSGYSKEKRQNYNLDHNSYYNKNFDKDFNGFKRRIPNDEFYTSKPRNYNIDHNSYYNQNSDKDFNGFKRRIPNDEFYTGKPRNYDIDPNGYYNQHFVRNFNRFKGRIPNEDFFTQGFPLYLVTPADNGPNPPPNIPNVEIIGAKVIPDGIVPIYNIHRFREPQHTRVPYRPFTAYSLPPKDGKLIQHPQIYPTSFLITNPQSKTSRAYSPNHSVLNSGVGYTTSHDDPDLITRRNVLQNSFKPIRFDNYLSEFPTHNNDLRKLYIPNLYRNQQLFRPRFGFSNIYGLAF